MRISVFCIQCIKEGKIEHPSQSSIHTEYYEDLVVRTKCKNGHVIEACSSAHKFEVLLESAVDALIDGYTIQAAFSFCLAYERFFEFCIRVLCNKKGIDKLEFEKTFAQMSKHSERQLGAFMFLYLAEFGKHYKLKESSITSFRNDVIHKGKIPTPDEVEKIANDIYNEIYSITQLLESNCKDSIDYIIFEDIAKRDPQNRMTRYHASFFTLSRKEQKKKFNEALSSYKEHRTYFPYSKNK
jgi:hypothetical protein